MRYGYELRQRAVGYVRNGGSKAEAARVYAISRTTLDKWLSLDADALRRYEKPGPKQRRKLKLAEVEQAVLQRPDVLQKELASALGVHKSSIHRAFKQLGISRKKTGPTAKKAWISVKSI